MKPIKDILRWVTILTCVSSLIWIFANSFRSEASIRMNPFALNRGFTLKNFENLLSLPDVGTALANSIVIAGSASLVSLLIAFPGAILLSRMPSKSVRALTGVIAVTYVLYPVSLGLPYFQFLRTVGLIDTGVGITLAHVGILYPLMVLLMQNALRAIPDSLNELADMYGMAFFQRLRLIVWPFIRVAFSALLLIAFTISWREYFFSFLLSLTSDSRNLVVYQVSLASSDLPDWGLLFAMNLLLLTPALFAAFLLPVKSNYFVERK